VIARFWMVTLAGVLLSAQQQPRGDVGNRKEAGLNASLANEVRQHTSAISDSTVHDYIDRVGRRLAAQLPAGDSAWDFALIRDDVGGSTHEPLSLQGGYIFVPASLVLAAHSESELAGMLAHSMAHVAERSSTGHALFGGWVGTGPSGEDDHSFLPTNYLKIQRGNELDADRMAVNVMANAGFGPAALLGYIRRTQRALAPEARPFSGLPTREERIGVLETVVAHLPSRAGMPGGEFRAVQDRLRRNVQR
jgi:predicted Zn-dependent protease